MATYDNRTALIVVDMQNDFGHPNGSLFVKGAPEMFEVVNDEIRAATAAGALVVYTQDWHPESTPHFQKDGGLWPVHCVADSWGAAFMNGLDIVDGPIVRKGVDGSDGYSAFSVRDPESGETAPTALEEILRDANITRTVVVGLATDYCVVESAADSVARGFDTVVVEAGVAAVDLEPGDGERALARLRDLGVLIA